MDQGVVGAGRAAALGFVCSLASALFIGWGFVYSAFFLLIALGLLVLGKLLLFREEGGLGYIILAAFLFIGAALGALRVSLISPPDISMFLGDEIILYGEVVSHPEERDSYKAITVKAEGVSNERVCAKLDTRILVRADRFSDIAYGDVVSVEGKLESPEPFETETGRTFYYDRYLAVESVFGIMSFAEVEVHGRAQGSPVLAALFRIKEAYVESLERLLPEPEASLAAGITVGTRGSLTEDFREKLISSGVVHVVVLSGYNVAIVIASLLFIFRFLPRALRFVIAVGSVCLFVLLVGAEPSLVRASIMAFIALGALYTDRSSSAMRALGITALLMLVVDPRILWSPSFILSILATSGLVVLSPLIEEKLLWIRYRGLRLIVAATLATQTAVLPYLLYSIGEVSLVSLPANVFILLSVPFAMLFSFLAGLFGIFLAPAGVFFSWAAFVFLRYETLLIDLFSRLPFASIVIPPFSVVFLFLAYGFLVTVSFRLIQKHPPGLEGVSGAVKG